jgi:hypothetical protein
MKVITICDRESRSGRRASRSEDDMAGADEVIYSAGVPGVPRMILWVKVRSEGKVPDKAWSLWSERRLMLVMVKHILLETISLTNLFKNIHRLAELCANSKRKRLPAFYRFLVPK